MLKKAVESKTARKSAPTSRAAKTSQATALFTSNNVSEANPLARPAKVDRTASTASSMKPSEKAEDYPPVLEGFVVQNIVGGRGNTSLERDPDLTSSDEKKSSTRKNLNKAVNNKKKVLHKKSGATPVISTHASGHDPNLVKNKIK